MTWELLLSVAALALLGLFWHSSLAAREIANRVAQETCNSASVQMLDGTVAIHRLRLVRSADQPRRHTRETILAVHASARSRQFRLAMSVSSSTRETCPMKYREILFLAASAALTASIAARSSAGTDRSTLASCTFPSTPIVASMITTPCTRSLWA